MAEAAMEETLTAFLDAHPGLERIELLFPDMNGVLRGKWLPAASAKKLAKGGVRLPVSTYALNIWGEDVDATGLALARGDPDGIGRPVIETLSLTPWGEGRTAQVLMTLLEPDGAPTPYDPRQRLAAVAARFADRGLTPVVATELEFYLITPPAAPGDAPTPPPGFQGAQVYDMAATERAAPVLEEVQAACRAMGVPADSVIAEFGSGQFEINMTHLPDALAAADAAVLFKRVVRTVAQRHGLDATFMAKPYGLDAGSGMHVHMSLIDGAGRNVFDGADLTKSALAPPLAQAIGGALTTMRPLQAIFAPHRNSYRRFQPGSYAPVTPNWGYDHRGAAVRLPETTGPGARFEHRIAGADVNPYLAIAAVLGGALIGLEDALDPGPPIDAGAERGLPLHHDWRAAVEDFAASEAAARVFGEPYRAVYAACRLDELDRWAGLIGSVEYETYLSRL